MNQFITAAKVIAPIFTAVFLGILARKRKLMQPEEVRGLQAFVLKFGLPCVLFNSCLTANVGAESLGTMLLVLPCVLLASLWAFQARKKRLPYHNLPMLFSAQETGMLGIPLFMILFGNEEAYRMGILDITQALIAFPTIAVLTARIGETPSVVQIVKKVLTSPLLIISAAGLILNLTGVADILNRFGIGGLITESTGFLAQPVSAIMIFSVGYNFSLSGENRSPIIRIALIHLLMYALIGGIIQLGLFLIPHVDSVTRWAVLMYSFLPASFLAPGLGRSDEDISVSSGVCSVLTVLSLAVFCVIAAFVA